MGYARTKLEEATERVKELERKFTCYKCGDGNTPLYCLNCANDALKAKLEAAERACAEMRDALDWFDPLSKKSPVQVGATRGDTPCPACAPHWNKEKKEHAELCWLARALSSTCGQGYKSPAEYSALQKENEQLKEQVTRSMEELVDIVSRHEEYVEKNEKFKNTLKVIAQDIGSTHAATKAKEALSALVKEWK